MAIKYQYDDTENVVHTIPYGDHTSEDAHEHFQALIDDEQVKSGFIDVVHYEEVERFIFQSKGGKSITKVHNALKDKKSVVAIIFIAHTPIQFGMARMMQSLHEINDPEDKVFIVKSDVEASQIIQKLRKED